MARVLMTNLISSITGRFGGGVFRNWKGLTVLSALPDSVDNPSTAAQVDAREILTYCSKQWAGLSEEDRAAWAACAQQLTEQWENFDNEVGIKGVCRTPRGPFTPIGAMVSAHGLLASVGAWDSSQALLDGPAGIGAPSQPTDVEVSQVGPGPITVTWTDPATWGQNAQDGYVRIWLRSENGIYHTQLAGYAAAATETYDITSLRTADGLSSTLAPGWTYIQLDAVNANGLRGAPSLKTSGDLAESLEPAP